MAIGNGSNISKSYEYKMKSDIRKKLKFFNLELPLIHRSRIFSDDLTVFGKNLAIFSKTENSTNSSIPENRADIGMRWKG